MAYGQSDDIHNDDSLSTQYLEDGSRQLNLFIPSDYVQKDTMHYVEGLIVTFVYDDKSSITVLCGANANLQVSEDSANLYSRKIIVDGFQITYEQVPQSKLSLFNRAFDLTTTRKPEKPVKKVRRLKK